MLSFDAPSSDTVSALTPSERGVVALVAVGRSNAEIAKMRNCSVRTVENQLHAVYQKLGVHSRSELICALTSKGEHAP